MQIELDTPQRVAIVIEKNKSDTGSVNSYLMTADGRRERRSLGGFRKLWQRHKIVEESLAAILPLTA